MKNHILVYNILYKMLITAKFLRNRFDQTDEFIRDYDGTHDGI